MITVFKDLDWVKGKIIPIKFSWTWIHIALAIFMPGYLILAAIGMILNQIGWINFSRIQQWVMMRF